MGINYRPLDTKCWERFLKLNGFVYDRTKGSHDLWVKAGKRTIPVVTNLKQIPAFHLIKSCSSITCTSETLFNWAKENC